MRNYVITALLLGLTAALNISEREGSNQTKNPLLHRSSHVTRDVKHQLTCYEYADGQGDSVVLKDYTPFFANYNFDNRASYCCFDGIWVLYAEENYNENAFSSPTFYAWGENYCTNFDQVINDVISSARFVGAPDGYKFDTLNIYAGEAFMGEEKFSYSDIASFEKVFAKSIIVTGCNPWTIYEEINYQGKGVCLYPSDGTQCSPSFFPKAVDLFGLADKVSSARRGCFIKDIHKSDPNMINVHKKSFD